MSIFHIEIFFICIIWKKVITFFCLLLIYYNLIYLVFNIAPKNVIYPFMYIFVEMHLKCSELNKILGKSRNKFSFCFCTARWKMMMVIVFQFFCRMSSKFKFLIPITAAVIYSFLRSIIIFLISYTVSYLLFYVDNLKVLRFCEQCHNSYQIFQINFYSISNLQHS